MCEKVWENHFTNILKSIRKSMLFRSVAGLCFQKYIIFNITLGTLVDNFCRHRQQITEIIPTATKCQKINRAN